MFSTSQQEYIKSIIPTYAKEGYRYYICFTNSLGSNGSSYYAEPDLYFYFSKKEITAEGAYHFTFEDYPLVVAIRCNNYSSYNGANNTARVSVSERTSKTLSIDVYEHVYTNAKFETVALQPDYNLISGGETNVRLEAITFILLFIFIFSSLSKLLRLRR